MEPDRKPEIVDLARYKQAVKAQAKRKAVQAPKSEPLLGARPRAGLILVLAVVALAAFWILSNLH